MRQLPKSTICLAFLLCLRCVVWAAQAQSQPAASRQRKSIVSNNSNGGGGYALRRRNIIIGDENGDGGSDVHINIIAGDEIPDSSRKLQNKITSNHIIQLEFNGVTYASMSLDVVKEDLIDVVEDVLNTHLGNNIEVVDVQKGDCSPNCRKLRSSSQRILSYIRLVVSISLRHSSWITSDSALATTIEILSEYVDNDFGQYMRSLPGNGDYVGTVDVSDYYGSGVSISLPSASGEPDISVNLPSTTEPDMSVGLPSTTEPMSGDEDGPKPTQAPPKVITPANDWINLGAGTMEMTIPWWGWILLGVGVASIALCCCCCILQYTRRKRAATTEKPRTMTNIIQVREPTKKPVKSMNAKESVDFSQYKKSTSKNDGGKEKATLSAPLQISGQQLLYNPNPTSDLVLYEPNINVPDPDERIQEPKKKKKKKKKQKKPTSDLVLYEPNMNAPDPDEMIQEPKKKKKKEKKRKKPRDP